MDFKITNALEDLKQGVNIPGAASVIMDGCEALVKAGLWDVAASTLVAAYELIPFGWVGDKIKEGLLSKAQDIVVDKIADTPAAKAVIAKVKSLNPFGGDDTAKKPDSPKAPAGVAAQKPKAAEAPAAGTKPEAPKPAAAKPTAAPPAAAAKSPAPPAAPPAAKPAAETAPSPLKVSPPAPASAHKKRPVEGARMAPIQNDRQVKVKCDSLNGTGFELLFRSMSASEALGGLFEYNVELLCTNPNVPMEKVLGSHMTLSLEVALPAATPPNRRYFNGYVSAFHFVGLEGEFSVFGATLRPDLWLLTRNQDCRVWIDKTVPQVVESIFSNYSLTFGGGKFLSNDRGEVYKSREYCVQYNETDFAFVSRLLEEEGIHYFFVHEDGKHTLYLADSLMGHEATPGYEVIPFALADRRSDRDVEAVTAWSVHQTVEADWAAVGDFDFKDPRLDTVLKHVTTSIPVLQNHPKLGDFVRYQYPEPIVKMVDYGPGMAGSIAKVRAQEIQAQWEVIEAKCSARGLVVGGTFKLSGHPRDSLNTPTYLVTGAAFNIHSNDYQSTSDATQPLTYTCSFWAINSQTPFRPQRRTPKPLISGPQTGIVVGDGGAPIHTDKFGRVKVAFPWMLPKMGGEGGPAKAKPPAASWWVRVSQIWAGQGWGSMHLPHVGQEVIVSFLDGDPDRPIVTGRVYNGQNNPWQKLGDHATRSYISDQVGNRIVMQSKEAEKGISIHTPSLETHLWLGKKDGIELPDGRSEFVKKAADAVNSYLGTSVAAPPSVEGGVIASTQGDILMQSEGAVVTYAGGPSVTIASGDSIQIKDSNSFSITKGISKTFSLGASVDVKAAISAAVSMSASTEVKVGAAATISYGLGLSITMGDKWDYSKEKKHTIGKKSTLITSDEQRFQVAALPELKKLDKQKSLGRSLMKGIFSPGVFAELFKKPQGADKADAEMLIKPDRVVIRCAQTSISIDKEGNVLIEAPKGAIKMKTEEVEVTAPKGFTVNGKTVHLKAKTVHATSNLTAKDD